MPSVLKNGLLNVSFKEIKNAINGFLFLKNKQGMCKNVIKYTKVTVPKISMFQWFIFVSCSMLNPATKALSDAGFCSAFDKASVEIVGLPIVFIPIW